jgi:hypothetical protein
VAGCGTKIRAAAIRHTEPIINEESRKTKLSPGAPARSPVVSAQHCFRQFGEVTIQDRPSSVKNFPHFDHKLLNY